MVLAYQTSGDFLRWNPHFHCLMLEGGFDERGKFVHILLGDIHRMSEYFRRVVINYFLKKQLINAHLATSLINWKLSGFSVDHSIRIPAFSVKAIHCPRTRGTSTLIASTATDYEAFPVQRQF